MDDDITPEGDRARESQVSVETGAGRGGGGKVRPQLRGPELQVIRSRVVNSLDERRALGMCVCVCVKENNGLVIFSLHLFTHSRRGVETGRGLNGPSIPPDVRNSPARPRPDTRSHEERKEKKKRHSFDQSSPV